MIYKDGVGVAIGENALLGKTPSFVGWNTDPSGDVANLTDGNPATVMTSGSKTLGAGWQYAFINFTVPNGIYLIGGAGKIACVGASGFIYITSPTGYDNVDSVGNEDIHYFTPTYALIDGNTIQFSLTADGASTITPSINEVWAIRLA